MAINWARYPPAGQDDRIKTYEHYEGLFLGQHQAEFKVKTGGPYQLARYIVANFPAVLSNLAADMLFGEPPDFLVTDRDNEAAQEALTDLVQANDLHVLGYEAALAGSFRGDTVLKARWGNRMPDVESPEAIIEEVPAAIYFPEFAPDNLRQVVRVSLAWMKPDPRDPKVSYVRVEEHEPGLLRNRLFRRRTDTTDVEEVDIQTLEEYADLPAEQPTGLPMIPVFHVPNFRYGSRFWGISDYQGLESVIEALNGRLSAIDAVLDKHVAPKMVVPPSMLDEDGKVKKEQLELVVVAAGEQPPSYITWDASLTAAYAEVDKLMELLFILSETGPSIFGLDKYGVAQSGTALKLRLIRTVAKINRKRLYLDRSLREALWAAQLLQKEHGGAAYEPCPVSISWADGLPEDIREMVEIESQRLAAGNTSVESSIRRLDGPEAVEGEMDRIAEEQAQAMALTGAGRGPQAGGDQGTGT